MTTMPEILYEIPVNDIFDRPCECPVCAMKKKLDDDEVAFAMGPSYMEDDIRLTTDKIGFCAHHMQMMYDFENRLGLGLILNTHMQNIIKNVETLQKKKRNGSKRLFAKTNRGIPRFRIGTPKHSWPTLTAPTESHGR